MDKIRPKDSNVYNEEILQKVLLFKALQQLNEDLEIPSIEASHTITEEFSNNDFEDALSENSISEKIDEEQIFFNQKRDRIKRKIEENIPKNTQMREKQIQKPQHPKEKSMNFVQKNSVMTGSCNSSKEKSLTKRLNGLSVRINQSHQNPLEKRK